MSPTEVIAGVALLLGAIAGLLTASGTFNADRRKARRERIDGDSGNAAVLLASWKELGDSISSEVERVRRSCAEEITKLKVEHAADKAEWQAEKKGLHEEVEALKAQVVALMQLAKRPSTRRDRATDR